MMWCNDCKKIVITDVEHHYVRHSHLDGCPIEEWTTDVCDECGSDDLSAPETCRHCGEPMNPYGLNSPQNVCDDCLNDIDYALGVALRIIARDNRTDRDDLLSDMLERLENDESIEKIIEYSKRNESPEKSKK